MSTPACSPALGRIAPSATTAMTDRAAALVVAGRDIIALSVGEPDFPTPPHVIAAAKAALDNGQTRYTPVAGTAQLREAAARHYARDLDMTVEPSEVIVTAGGKQALFEAIVALVSPDQEVIIPAPWWVSTPQMVRFAGGRVVPLVTHASRSFAFDPLELERAIGPNTRLLMLNSPGNPTGAVYDAELLKGIAAVLRRHERVMVISDDIYALLSFTGALHRTLAALAPDLKDRILTVSGVSKSHAMTGFRIGVAAGPRWWIDAIAKLQSHASGNPSSISQAAACAAFDGPQGFLDDWRKQFLARRDRMVSAVNAVPGLSTPVPDGAFYCLVDAGPLAQAYGGDDTRLALHLLENGVAVVPGSAFHAPFGFRLSFAVGEPALHEAMTRIAAALAR